MRFLFNMTVYCLLSGLSIGASTEFNQLIDNYWEWRMEDAPEFATRLNVNKYNNRSERYDIAVLEERKEAVDGYLTKLGNIDRSLLSDTDKVSYDVLKDTLTTFSEGYSWKNYGVMNPVNFLQNLLTDPGLYGPSHLFVYADFEDYVKRLDGFTHQVDGFIARMHIAFVEKTTNHWVSMNRVVPQFEEFINTARNQTSFLKPFLAALDNTSLTVMDKNALTVKAEKAMTGLQKKYTELNNFLQSEYKQRARQAYGVNSFKNGEEYYQACLKWHLSTDITPEEIHNLGRDEVQRIQGEMMKVMTRLNFTGTTKAFFDSLNKDPRFFLKTAEEIIQRYTEIINIRVKPKLQKFFKNIPDMPVVVEEMPYDGPGASYSFGAPDGSKPGLFYVNVKRPKDNPTYKMVALTLHEADPGHHLQDTYAQASKSMPVFRRVLDDSKYFAVPVHFPFYTAYLEGWGLYAESLGEQLDIYQDDYELMGRYSSEIFRACRLVVDTGLHHYNWTRDEAIEFMLNYTSYSRDSIEIEIDRYITWPGQACAYKIGELKIKELRKQAELELGQDFDIRDFHSVILDNGAVPLNVLEQLVDEWIIKTKAPTDSYEEIAKDFFAWRLRDSPEFALGISNHYNDKVNSYKYENFEFQKGNVSKFHKRLHYIDRNSLSPEARVSYDILEDILSTFLAGYKWKDYEPLNPINFIEGWHVDFGGLTSYITWNTQGDFINYVRKLELLSDQYEEMMTLMKKAISNGNTNHNASVFRVIKQLEQVTTRDVYSTDLYKPFIMHAERLFGNGPELAHVHNRLVHALESLKMKLNKVSTFLTDEYIPKTRHGLGIGTLPNGRKNYEACLKWHTSMDISPEEVHEIGKQEVTRIEGRIRESMAYLSYNSSWSISQLYQHMLSDEQFLIPTAEETIAHFRDIIYERIQPKITKYFSNVPDFPLVVKPTVSDGIGGMYVPGSADGSVPGIFYANVHRKEDNPTFTMITLSLHEAIPGHHLAESFTKASDLPSFRKHMEWTSYNVPYFFPFYNAYVEGWALYSEYLGEEMGVYENHYELLGRFSEEMWRACRLVVDTGIHYYNWTREQAIGYMLDHSAMTPNSAAIEVDRYATWPGQACGYKMGEIKIKNLRKRAEEALGDRFDIRDFHYTVLKNGPMPLSVLEDVVDEWIQSSKTNKVTQVPFAAECAETTSAMALCKPFEQFIYLIIVLIAFIFF